MVWTHHPAPLRSCPRPATPAALRSRGHTAPSRPAPRAPRPAPATPRPAPRPHRSVTPRSDRSASRHVVCAACRGGGGARVGRGLVVKIFGSTQRITHAPVQRLDVRTLQKHVCRATRVLRAGRSVRHRRRVRPELRPPGDERAHHVHGSRVPEAATPRRVLPCVRARRRRVHRGRVPRLQQRTGREAGGRAAGRPAPVLPTDTRRRRAA